MKICFPPTNSRRSERGSAVMLVMTMLGIMVICVSVNAVAVMSLTRELKLLEKKQVQRLQTVSAPKSAQTATPSESAAVVRAETPLLHE
jgi:hypothetical protein